MPKLDALIRVGLLMDGERENRAALERAFELPFPASVTHHVLSAQNRFRKGPSMSTTQPVNGLQSLQKTRAPRSTAAARMAATRARQRRGSVLVRVEVPRTVIDGLVSAGALSETERTDRVAIQRVVTDVLNALPPLR